MNEKTFRNKVSWLMFLFSILVIWVHSYNVELFAGAASGSLSALWERAAWLENFVSVGIGQIAVPGFFMLSSYLFFRNFAWEKLAAKWRGRFFSVVIPYTVWNILYYLGYVLASRAPMVRAVVGKEPVPFGILELLGAVFRYSYAPIFWYLYQLIILIFLSPAIYLFVKKRTWGAVYLAALVLAVHFHLDSQHPNTDALLYYSFAAYMAVHGRDLVEGAWDKRRGLAGAAVILLAAVCFQFMARPGSDVLWTVFYRLLAPVGLWLFLDGSRLSGARPWMRQSMFLYAVHYMIVRFVNKGTAMILSRVLLGDQLAWAALAVYFLLPVVVVWVSYGAAVFLGRLFPGLWRILSGGRNLEGN